MQFKVYVLYSSHHDKLFTGMTASLVDRMMAHNGSEVEDWTTVYKPWTLVHMELFDDEADAALRESFLESASGQEYLRSDILPLFQF